MLAYAVAADPINPNVIFVSGDTEEVPFPKADGTCPLRPVLPRRRLARPDCSGRPWTAMAPAGAASHADSRDFKFDARGDLLQADDGGIYRLNNPNNFGRAGPRALDLGGGARPRQWRALFGRL